MTPNAPLCFSSCFTKIGFSPKNSSHNHPSDQVNLPGSHLRATIPPGIGTLQSLPVTPGDLPRITAESAFLHCGDPGTSWLPSTGGIPLRTFMHNQGCQPIPRIGTPLPGYVPSSSPSSSGDEVPSSLFPSYFFRGRMVDDVPGFLPFQGRGHRYWIVSCDTIEEDTLRSCSWDAAQMPIAGALAPIESLTCQRPLPRVASRCPGLGRPSRFQDTFVLPPCSACSVPALTFALHGNRCLGLVHHFHSFPFFSALSRFPESVILCCVCCFLLPPSRPCFFVAPWCFASLPPR